MRRPTAPRVRLAATAAAIAFAMALPGPVARAADPAPVRHHALSLVHTPQYGPDFKHFDWVNPDAPKGGTIRMAAFGTFDSLNAFSLKGTAADGLGRIYDSLMESSSDEPSTEYGLIAESVSYPDDYSSATFYLRPAARFHDGTPITPEDVIFSLDALKRANPGYALYYKNVVGAEKAGDHAVTFRFDVKGNRELPHIMGQLAVLPKHFWQGKDASGQPRDITKSSMEVPLGSGPYRVKSFEPGRSIVYERVKDYWAKDLPVAKGQWNFDEVRYEYYRDRVPAFEAFKAGDIDFWYEASAKSWATAYDFEAVRRKWVLKEEWPIKRLAPMQAFAFNVRRPIFQDVRIRKAFNLAFDFQWMSTNILYGQYKRVASYFQNSELAESGLPEGRELQILNEVRSEVPPEVFTTPFANPVNNGPDDFRRHMREASQLLAQAGWKPKGGTLVNAAGQPLAVEFLLFQPDFTRIVDPYKRSLERLGIKVNVRVVDAAQYQQRRQTFDFDIIVASFAQSESPGNEQREYWGSGAADREGSRNIIGIKNPAIDKLIDKVIFAKDRADLVAATHALDRVLLWNYYVVPQWYAPNERVALWDKFARPKKTPTRAGATTRFLQVWWYDPAAAAKLKEARR